MKPARVRNHGEARPTSTRRPSDYEIFVRDLRVNMSMGIHPHEKRKRQPVVINLVLKLSGYPREDAVTATLDYDRVTRLIRTLGDSQHFALQETFAFAIAESCLKLTGVESAKVRVEKPEAYRDCHSVGVELEMAAKNTAMRRTR